MSGITVATVSSRVSFWAATCSRIAVAVKVFPADPMRAWSSIVAGVAGSLTALPIAAAQYPLCGSEIATQRPLRPSCAFSAVFAWARQAAAVAASTGVRFGALPGHGTGFRSSGDTSGDAVVGDGVPTIVETEAVVDDVPSLPHAAATSDTNTTPTTPTTFARRRICPP